MKFLTSRQAPGTGSGKAVRTGFLLDGVEFQAVLALKLFHLISLENAFAIFGMGQG
ncbi:MAG: hypothetical protein K1Y36_25870 [Blastocatellia bacterium]|nr:hypothetical protein [Blastocatellia bacterium]